MKKPLVSIIITNLNGKSWINGLFSSLKSQVYKNIEIIFVDGDSTDGSLEEAKKYLKDFKKWKTVIEKRPGWSLANNVGARFANGEINFFLSNDMEVERSCISEIVQFLDKHKEVAMLQCHSLSLYDKKTLDSGMNFIDRFGFLYGYRPTKSAAKTFMAEGMAFASRSNIYDKTKLDNEFIMEYDDVDLSWKVRLLGYEVAFLPTAKVFHGRGGTVGKTYFERNLRNIKQYNRNHLVSLTRYLETSNLIISLPLVLSIRFVSIFYFFLRGNITLAKATFDGIFWFFAGLPKTLKERERFQKKRRISDRELSKFWVPFQPTFILSWLRAQNQSKRLALPAAGLPKELFLKS